MTGPTVSVVMPMYNAMPYLPAAIESVLAQTYGDFELVIGDDGSDDGSYACAEAYARRDSRVRLLRGEYRRGPAGSSEWVVQASKAELVARMDADDISAPRRLERQVAIMATHPQAVLVGSVFEMINADGRMVRNADREVLTRNGSTPPIAHTSIMVRRKAFDIAGGYSKSAEYFEDVDLYRRLLAVGDMIIISDPLVSYRCSGANARLRDDRKTVERFLNVQTDGPDTQPQPSAPARLAPEVFRTLGTIRLWSGRSPGVLMAMARRMRLRPLRRSLPCLAWALSASVCPPLARQLARARLEWRHWRARRRVSPGHAYRWRPDRPLVDLGEAP